MFIILRDQKNYFRFASLQSVVAEKILSEYGVTEELKTIVLIENGKVFRRSGAALRICRHLSGGWPLCYGFLIIPAFIRDGIYNLISKYRYKWFGKKDQCMIPTPELRSKFLEYEPQKENIGTGGE